MVRHKKQNHWITGHKFRTSHKVPIIQPRKRSLQIAEGKSTDLWINVNAKVRRSMQSLVMRITTPIGKSLGMPLAFPSLMHEGCSTEGQYTQDATQMGTENFSPYKLAGLSEQVEGSDLPLLDLMISLWPSCPPPMCHFCGTYSTLLCAAVDSIFERLQHGFIVTLAIQMYTWIFKVINCCTTGMFMDLFTKCNVEPDRTRALPWLHTKT